MASSRPGARTRRDRDALLQRRLDDLAETTPVAATAFAVVLAPTAAPPSRTRADPANGKGCSATRHGTRRSSPRTGSACRGSRPDGQWRSRTCGSRRCGQADSARKRSRTSLHRPIYWYGWAADFRATCSYLQDERTATRKNNATPRSRPTRETGVEAATGPYSAACAPPEHPQHEPHPPGRECGWGSNLRDRRVFDMHVGGSRDRRRATLECEESGRETCSTPGLRIGTSPSARPRRSPDLVIICNTAIRRARRERISRGGTWSRYRSSRLFDRSGGGWLADRRIRPGQQEPRDPLSAPRLDHGRLVQRGWRHRQVSWKQAQPRTCAPTWRCRR